MPPPPAGVCSDASPEANFTIITDPYASPPIRGPCHNNGYAFCVIDDDELLSMGYCEMDPYCQETFTSQPWMGWTAKKPYGLALANGSSLEGYEETSALCLSMYTRC